MPGVWDNVVLTKTVAGVSTQVTIGVTRDVENITKLLTLIKIPITKVNQEAGTPTDTRSVDLLRVEQRITINGHLVTALGSGDTSSNASDKKRDLKNIILAGGVISMTYENTSFNINIDKAEIVRNSFDGVEPTSGESGFDVMLSCIRTEDAL